MRRKRVHNDEPFQMAPMIDMVFLLLVFFMTVSTMARDARPEVELPLSASASVPEAVLLRDILTIIEEQSGAVAYYWHSRRVQPKELSAILGKTVKNDNTQELLLRGSPDLPWREWDRVIQMCREAGLDNLIFATYER